MAEMEIADIDIVEALDGFHPTSDDDGFVYSGDAHQEHGDSARNAPDLVSLTSNSKEYRLTGRPSIQLYLSCDPMTFSEFQGKITDRDSA